jgi:hypothetical protein
MRSPISFVLVTVVLTVALPAAPVPAPVAEVGMPVPPWQK